MVTLYIAIPSTPGVPIEIAGRDFSSLAFRQGLDLQGGLHVRFQAKPPTGQELQDGDLQAVKRIIENRVNALGVSEPLIQIEGKDRLIVELPGIDDPTNWPTAHLEHRIPVCGGGQPTHPRDKPNCPHW